MGRVELRQAQQTAREQSIAQAIQRYSSRKHISVRDARYSRLWGRQNARKLDQTSGTAEERKAVKRFEVMDRRGFPLGVCVLVHMATNFPNERTTCARRALHIALLRPLSAPGIKAQYPSKEATNC